MNLLPPINFCAGLTVQCFEIRFFAKRQNVIGIVWNPPSMNIENYSTEVFISSEPNIFQLEEIESWLIEEASASRTGFYCNWNVIKCSFENGRALTISLDNLTVGFLTWDFISDYCARIEITEIVQTHRSRGIGTKLVAYAIDYLTKLGLMTVEVQCAPRESEKFWRGFGFIDFPLEMKQYHSAYNDPEIYKILVSTAIPVEEGSADEFLDVWHLEPIDSKNVLPNLTFNLNFVPGSRKLSKPIIVPCEADWKLKWRNRSGVLGEAKAKSLFDDDIVFGSFLILKNLPELA